MVRLHFGESLGLAALVRGVLAARGEPAAGGGIDGARQLALQDLALDGVVDVHRRDGGQQRPGVGVHGLLEQVLGGTLLHHLAQVHDQYADVQDENAVADVLGMVMNANYGR